MLILNFHQIFPNFANFFSSYESLKYYRYVQKHENSKFVKTVFSNSNSTCYVSICLIIDNMLFCIEWLRQKTIKTWIVQVCLEERVMYNWKARYLWHLIHFAWLHYTFYFEKTVWASDNMWDPSKSIMNFPLGVYICYFAVESS